MELLNRFKQHGYFTAELYNLLAKNKLVENSEEIIPSEYLKEMSLNTSERLLNLNNIMVENLIPSGKGPQNAVLSITPKIIIFQNFKPNDKIVAKFTVKNISNTSTFVNMTFKESSYFFIKSSSGQLLSRLAPGIGVTFALNFRPTQFADYTHQVTFTTDKDQYVLPLIAMGPRPIIDFPDEITIAPTPLKIENSNIIRIHNVALVNTSFTLNTKSPFSVNPKSVSLGPGEGANVTVSLKTMYLGRIKGALYAVFETGENFRITLRGSTHLVSIEIEKQTVRFFETYNSMVRQQTFKITNDSPHLLTYVCMKNDCVSNDFEEKLKLAKTFHDLKESETNKYRKLVQYDVLSSEEHERIYTRIFMDEIQALIADESLQFQNTHFSITPIKGNLWPNKTTEVTVTFAPKNVGDLEATAYFDIDGVQDRLPLRMTGISLPPSISLNLETLDMDRVYINETYHYEVVAINKGHINGVIVFKETPMIFGSHVTCTPEFHCLKPGDKELFVISFCNSNNGPYFEEVNFVIRDSDIVLKLYLKGVVQFPSLTFSTQCLDFGIVSLGLPISLEFDVINESICHIEFNLKVVSDGVEENSVTLADYAEAENSKPALPKWPKEFTIEPSKTSVEPESLVTVRITLVANIIREIQTSLYLEVEKTDGPPLPLPIKYNAKVPEILPLPNLKIPLAFLNHIYEREIHFTGNGLWGYFQVKNYKEHSLEVDFKVNEGYVEPNKTVCLPVEIKTHNLGAQSLPVRLHLFGLSEEIELCEIETCGSRPIVTCYPSALHWGQLKLLKYVQKTLTLCNDSPNILKYKAFIVNSDDNWQIEPTHGNIQANSEMDLVFEVYLVNPGSFTNKAIIQIDETKDLVVPLSATGTGTSILVGDLLDRIDLGLHFTKVPLKCKVIIENRGSRTHTLEWASVPKAFRNKMNNNETFFQLEPRNFKMAKEKTENTITGFSSKVATIKETWYLFGSVEGINNKKELLIECPISAEFVDPKLEISAPAEGYEFWFEKGPYSEDYKLTDVVSIKNVSNLPVMLEINVKQPFAIIKKQAYKIPSGEENLCCCMQYVKSDLNVEQLMKDLGPQQSKLYIDYLTLQPVEPLRKGPLEFFEDIKKIKMAFNLTHTIEERLEHGEAMKIHLLFDTTKHGSTKSKIYNEWLRIKYKDHPDKESVKLKGMIHYPNVLMLSSQIDFQGVLNDSVERRNLKIQNVTPLHVSYKFIWRKCNIYVPKELTSGSTPEIEDVPEINEPTDEVKPIVISTIKPDLAKPNENQRKSIPKVAPEENVAIDIKLPSVKRESEEYIKTRVLKMIAPMIDKDYGSQIKWCKKFPKITKSNRVKLNDILSVNPHRGHLNKNETQFISITFTPKQDIIVDAVLECQVLGGPAESIMVVGHSSPLKYNISPERVNFKIRSFTTNATEVLQITNSNKLRFYYRTYLNQPKPRNNLEGTILKIDPPEKLVDNAGLCLIQIVVKPGVLGYFNRTFLLQVGHCPHVPIEVFGWGGIPQVYLSSQKHDLTLFPEELGYLAISKLTTEYLDAVNDIFAKYRSKSQHLTTPLTETCLDDPALKKEWHICSSWDIYPSIMDIELAIERYLVTEHLEMHPEIVTNLLSSPKARHIPGFRTMTCDVDFGVVMTGSTARQTIDIVNYGPVTTKVHFSKATKFPLWLEFKSCGALLPGETKKIEATLKPTSDFFPESEQQIETDLSLEVPYGVTIPLKIRALCAVPYLVTTVTTMNFGLVKCGNKVVCSIPLKNIGKPTCVWYATLKMKVTSGPCMFLLDSSGSYAPDEGGWLRVSFKPTMDMVYEGTLIFRFHMNPKRMTIPVKGVGLSPRVQVIGPEIIFPATLPWAKPISIYFGITNPCPFPIELVFVHCDKKFDEEQNIFEVLCKYYDYPEEMIVPMIVPGHPLPATIMDFQRNIIDHAKNKKFYARHCWGRKDRRMFLENLLCTRSMALDAKAVKRLKSPKGQATVKKVRTQAEVAEDAIQAMKNANVDPLGESLIAAEPVIEPEIPKRRGMMIFFHGAPSQEEPCVEIAYAVGKSLGIPTINIDNTIVDALCSSQSEAKSIITASINEMYENINKHFVDNMDENLEEEFPDPDDEYNCLRKKISVISKKGSGSKKLANVTKKPAGGTISVASLGISGPSTMFHMDLIHDLLEEIFSEPRFDRGFVLDTLTSKFITKPQVLLTTTIKCKCSIKNIHLVLCHSDINKWVQAYDEAQREELKKNQPKVYEESEIQDIIRQFQEMTPEEYELAPPELKSVFLEHGLEERRKKYLEKKSRSQMGHLQVTTSERLNERSSILQTKTSEKLIRRSSVSIRRKSESRKSMNESHRSVTDSISESKRKLRREDSRATRKANPNIKTKQTSEYITMNSKFNEYNKQAYETLVTVANNWNVEECDLVLPLCGFSGQVLGGKKPRLRSDPVVSMLGGSTSDKGFPITIVLDQCLKYKKALVAMFKYSPVAKEAFEDDRPFDILRRDMERLEYTVLLPRTLPTMKQEESLQWRFLNEPIRKCQCVQQNFNLLDDVTQDNINDILSKWHCTCGKKVISAQTSTTEVPGTLDKLSMTDRDSNDGSPLPLDKVKSSSSLDNRLILEPGDLIRCKYTFSPKEVGYYNVKRFAEVNGWPPSRVTLNVFGVCDLPKIDSRPKKMFKNFIRRTKEDTTYRQTFLDDRKVFEFGPIFVGLNRTYEEKYTINLRNASLLTAEVSMEFKDAANVFENAKKNATLVVGGRDTVTISAAPAQVGEHTNVLLLSVKDNPDIITVNVACTGVVPKVYILPTSKSIECGKLLLYRRHDERFIVKNESALPIKWVIRNDKEFAKSFILAETSGIVNVNDNQVVHVMYVASEVGIIVNKTLIIDIYDAEGRGNPMKVEMLNLSAECYDVQVECGYENLNENYLNYENVKVNSTVARDLYLLNRGKYSIFFKLEKVKDFPEPSLLKSFETSQTNGLLPPSLKIVPITFQCTPKTSVKLLNVPAYNCLLLDGGKEQIVVAKFPIYVTIASYYNTFALFPLRQLNFKITAVGTLASRELFLENTSKCPFTYHIVLPSKYQYSTQEATPSTPSMGKGKDKLKTVPLKCGNFLIANDDNLLAPGARKMITVQFLATAPRLFEETITFVVSDTNPIEGEGVPMKLVGLGAMPSLDLWNIETTFREHHIVKSISEYKVPEVTPHCVFVEDTESLHFFSVIVQTKYTATIDLYNDGLVSCTVNMALKYQNNTNAEIFSLDKYETDIEPLVHKNLEIIFTPKALQEYRAVLEINLKLYENKSHTFKICLIGEGNIPRIAILKPNLKQSKFGFLNLPVTCVGSISKRVIKFQNISSVISQVELNLVQTPTTEQQSTFYLTADASIDQLKNETDQKMNSLKVITKPDEIFSVYVNFNPIKKGTENCSLNFKIEENPYEIFTVSCEAEAFMEDVVLLGLEAVVGEVEESMTAASSGTINSTKRRSKRSSKEHKKKPSNSFIKQSASSASDTHFLKYLLDFGGCELNILHKRSVIMVNNSDKVYKFIWNMTEYVVIKPSVGFISPAEEKDLEIMFISTQPIHLKRETVNCALSAISDDSLTADVKGTTWDSRKCVTMFSHSRETGLNERREEVLNEQGAFETGLGVINMAIVYSAKTEYTSYSCSLLEELSFNDTFIYQKRTCEFTVKNTSNVPMKISWNFIIDEQYPARLDKKNEDSVKPADENVVPSLSDGTSIKEQTEEAESIHSTLFSEDDERASVDTWFEVQLPFTINPTKECILPHTTKTFTIIFAPLDAFDYKVRLKSIIDNLDPINDQNISCAILAKSLIPYCHLEVEDSDYLTAGRRKVVGGVALPAQITILEFNVLGSGCYKKTIKLINPTNEGYDFVLERVMTEKSELVPVQSDKWKGFLEGGTTTNVTFTFVPTDPGAYETQWKFVIPVHSLALNLLVVGIVREPVLEFVPKILWIRNSLVGFTTTESVMLKNHETKTLRFEFKGNSLCDETGKNPVIVEPNEGVLKPCSKMPIKITYTPVTDGPLTFKIYCSIRHLTKPLTITVNALSYSIKPKVTYSIFGNEHELNSEAVTNIHLEETASTRERKIEFKIINEGSKTFSFDWQHNSASVKKYLQVDVEPSSGHVAPGLEKDCTLHFNLRKVTVHAFPVTLSIGDGPVYNINLHATIKKPLYRFSCKEIDFGKCFINAPEKTYKKRFRFTNDDVKPITLEFNFANLPELYLHMHTSTINVNRGDHTNIVFYFLPKEQKEYEFKVSFFVNSLCEEIITIRGEGVPLLFDLYEGCHKSYDLGHVKVGEKVVREIEVMNHSQVPIEATLSFRDISKVCEDIGTSSEATSLCYPTELDASPSFKHNIPSTRILTLKECKSKKNKNNREKDMETALTSLKVVPNKVTIKPHSRMPLKIRFKPVGLISDLHAQLNIKVFDDERPLVLLKGCATGMDLKFTQDALEFGNIRRRGRRVLKVVLMNNGSFGTRFWWQPIQSDEFTLSPLKGYIAPQANVTFTVSCRPLRNSPFMKAYFSLNFENHKPLELVLNATCVEAGSVQTLSMYFDAPVRGIATEYVTVTNPSDREWLVCGEVSNPGCFETLKEFIIEPSSTFSIPIHFKPKFIGTEHNRVLFSPLGDQSLLLMLEGSARHPEPNGTIDIHVSAKQNHTEELKVYHTAPEPESYVVYSEVIKTTPEKFEAFFDLKHPETIKVWGETFAICRWTFICFAECVMNIKVVFINEETKEYQYYYINVTVTPSGVVDAVTLVSHARETVQKEILVENKLHVDADFEVFSESDAIFHPDRITVKKHSNKPLLLTYSPLVVGVTEEQLEVRNNLVESYFYKLILKCLPAKTKKLDISTPLGTRIPVRLRVRNHTDGKADFLSTVSHPSIVVDKDYVLRPLEKGKFLVWFEPTELGEQICKVSFNSPIAGEFVFDITGTATTPKPQGPVSVRVGGSATICFKNVFTDTRTFKLSVDRKEFYLKTQTEQIKPKKEIKFAVFLQASAVTIGESPKGCLTIECVDPPEPGVQWVYFLQSQI